MTSHPSYDSDRGATLSPLFSPAKVTPALAALTGPGPVSPLVATERLEAYLSQRQLRRADGRITLDERVRALFDVHPQAPMFKVRALIDAHELYDALARNLS